MRQDSSSVEIQDPAIKKLGKKRSCLRRSCTSGLGCVSLFVIAIIVLVRIAIGPGPKDINGIPSHYPIDAFELYSQETVQDVRYISSHQKNRGFEIAALFPKAILAPIFLSFSPLNPEKEITKSVESGHVVYKKEVTWDDFVEFLGTPVTQDSDTIVMEWSNLGAQMDFIADFYTNEFEKNGFTTKRQTSEPGTVRIRFSKSDVSGTLYMEDFDTTTRGTDFAVLTVDFPPKGLAK